MSDIITITRIELQSPLKKTYALYNDDVFLIEVTEDTIVHFTISRGNEFTNKEFNKIVQHDKVNLCLRQAYNYLQRRPHLAKELQRKLKNKQYEQEIIDRAFLHLKKNKYINDDEYIQIFIRDAIRQAKSGPVLIKKKLAEKGALFNSIDQYMDELFPYEKQSKIAFALLDSKNNKLNEENHLKQKQKLQKYGIGRGFTWNILEPLINQFVQGNDI